ncbi:MAG: hypothetical protein KJ058_14925 [Thermoanaerobaculia bacterium]|nr:hypothetical protein [Thermoanaerobaculia bacterium]
MLHFTPAEHHLSTVPAELLEGERFVVWRSELRGGKPTKVPYIAGTTRKASSTDPSTWRTFPEALAAFTAAPAKWEGVGRVFAPEDRIVGVDLDDCFADGAPLPWAREILDRFPNAYVEVSPSRAGVKLWCRGEWRSPRHRVKIRSGEVEVYSEARYFTLTGCAFGDPPEKLADCRAGLDWLAARHFGDAPAAAYAPAPSAPPAREHADVEEMARLLAEDPETRAAWRGEASADRSASDWKLCIAALEAVEGDLTIAERVLALAPARRPKWATMRGGVSWIRYSLENAARQRAAFTPDVGQRLCSVFKSQAVEVFRTVEPVPVYRLTLDGIEVELGDGRDLLRFDRVRGAVLGSAQKLITLPAKEWPAVAELIAQRAIPCDEGGLADILLSAVENGVLCSHHVLPEGSPAEWAHALEGSHLRRSDPAALVTVSGRLLVFVPALAAFLAAERAFDPNPRAIARTLRAEPFNAQSVEIVAHGTRKRRAFVTPRGRAERLGLRPPEIHAHDAGGRVERLALLAGFAPESEEESAWVGRLAP